MRMTYCARKGPNVKAELSENAEVHNILSQEKEYERILVLVSFVN